MKIKIIQYYIGVDEKYLLLCKLVEELNRKYAQMHGYEYKFDYYQKNSKEEDLPVYEAGYKFKLQYITDNLASCDYLVFIDADAAISNPNIKIEDLIDDQHELFLSHANGKCDMIADFNRLYHSLNYCLQHKDEICSDWKNFCDKNQDLKLYVTMEKLSLGRRYFNEGLFVIKNTSKMKCFFEICHQHISLFQADQSLMGHDGRCISFFLQHSEYKDCETYLSDYAQGSIYGSYQNRYDEERTFIMHNYGCYSLDDRIKYICWLKSNKWWRSVFPDSKGNPQEKRNRKTTPILPDFSHAENRSMDHSDLSHVSRGNYSLQNSVPTDLTITV